jgi:hypothetical protein
VWLVPLPLILIFTDISFIPGQSPNLNLILHLPAHLINYANKYIFDYANTKQGKHYKTPLSA